MPDRILTYREAISEGLCQAMERDQSIFVTGIGVDYQSGIFGTTTEALKQFGLERVFESPAMENALTGIAIGAAAVGKRPVIVHARNDFMFLALDQLINLAAKWRYQYGGNAGSMPIVVRAIIGQGWGQGATHSQSLQSVLGHFPGLNVVMPETPLDAKGLLCGALVCDRPTVILEHRAQYEIKGVVPSEWYTTPLTAKLLYCGNDLTIVATSSMVYPVVCAVATLNNHSIDVIDARCIRPLDKETILKSVRKTGRLLVVDGSWELCGFASEVAALVAEQAFDDLRAPVKRITWPDCPCPAAASLEKQFYPTTQTIAAAANAMLGGTPLTNGRTVPFGLVPEFIGPY